MAEKVDTLIKSFRRVTSYQGIPESTISWNVVMVVE